MTPSPEREPQQEKLWRHTIYLGWANGFAVMFGYSLATLLVRVPVPLWGSVPLIIIAWLGMIGCHLAAHRTLTAAKSDAP